MKIKLRPFSIPNFVIQEMPPRTKQEGFSNAPSYYLSEVDAETLSDMCDKFREEIFKKAQKEDPKKCLGHK